MLLRSFEWLVSVHTTQVFRMDSVRAYYSGLNLQNQDFHLQPTSHKVVLKLIEEINPAKATGIDKLEVDS